MATLGHPATRIWLLLVGASALSWFLGSHGDDHRIGSVAVILIALVKIRLILRHFMELRHSPLVWRAIFEFWLVTVGVALVSFYLITR